MKMADYNAGRNDGLMLALRIAENEGIEALRKELDFRGVCKINTSLAKKDLEVAAQEIKENTVALTLALTICTLQDEFDFGKKRLNRFRERFNLKLECIIDDMLSWQDLFDDVKERHEIDLTPKIK